MCKDQTALLCGQQQEASVLKSCCQQNYGVSWEVSTKLGEEISKDQVGISILSVFPLKQLSFSRRLM